MHPGIEKLLDANDRLDHWRKAGSVPQLLDELGDFLATDGLTGTDLLPWLQRETSNLPAECLARHWFPFAWDARRNRLRWCLPDGRATEPFHDQYITRCRQQLLNQLFIPESALPNCPELAQAEFLPAGFIFHLSRCGSTLVSGSFAEMNRMRVLSESPLLTDFLLDAGVDQHTKKAYLHQLIELQAYGGQREAYVGKIARDKPIGEGLVVVKWNAWDIFQWPLIRACFPQVPVLLLVRHPLEILASHGKSPGRHMGADPSLRQLHSAFAEPVTTGLLNHQIAVLKALLESFCQLAGGPNIVVMDYQQLDMQGIQKIAEHFGVQCGADDLVNISVRMQRHSKMPNQTFKPDHQPKQAFFTRAQQDHINGQLGQLYQQLSRFF